MTGMKFSAREYLRDFAFSDVLKFDFRHLRGDLIGGLTSAIVALPLALGFGILAYNGDPKGAVAGLYGAIFTGVLAALFGGTPRQITGPTGKMVILVARLAKPIVYETLDGSAVDLVFMIASAADDDRYLQTLSLLAKTLREPGVLESIRAARKGEGIYDILAHEFARDGA